MRRCREEDEHLPGWYHYGMGRAHFHLRNFALAGRHMRHAVRGSCLSVPWRRR